MDRLTEPTVGCFLYQLKDHKAVPGEFGTYEAFFDYSMAVRKLGQYEATGLTPEQCRELAEADAVEVVRCGECEHRRMGGNAPFSYLFCMGHEDAVFRVEPDGFCSYGKREEQNDA